MQVAGQDMPEMRPPVAIPTKRGREQPSKPARTFRRARKAKEILDKLGKAMEQAGLTAELSGLHFRQPPAQSRARENHRRFP
jgi:hypothetical protein